MQFTVHGSDGKEYGPVDFPTLKEWTQQDRVRKNTTITDHFANLTTEAKNIEGLFPEDSSPLSFRDIQNEPPQQLQDPPERRIFPEIDENAIRKAKANHYFRWALIDSGLALVINLIPGGISFLIAIFAVYNGFQAIRLDHQYKWIAGFASASVFAFSLLKVIAAMSGSE